MDKEQKYHSIRMARVYFDLEESWQKNKRYECTNQLEYHLEHVDRLHFDIEPSW